MPRNGVVISGVKSYSVIDPGEEGQLLVSQGPDAEPVMAALPAHATSHSPTGSDPVGRWEPLTNGDPDAPELVFQDDGDIVLVFTP